MLVLRARESCAEPILGKPHVLDHARCPLFSGAVLGRFPREFNFMSSAPRTGHQRLGTSEVESSEELVKIPTYPTQLP